MEAQEHWMIHLQRVYYPTLAAIGIPSNIMSFVIFWRRKCMLSKSSTFYLIAISIADTAVLVFIVVLELSIKYLTVEPFWSQEPWCSLRDIFTYGASNTSTWLVVAFTAERFLSITTYSLRKQFGVPHGTLWTICIIFALGHFLALPYYWAYISTYRQDLQRWFCIYNPNATIHYTLAMVSMQTIVSHILPFVIIGVLNGLTLRQISLTNRVHTICTSGQKVTPLLRSRKRKSVVLLVTVSMTFVLLTITRSITQIILRTNGWTLDRDDYSLSINVAANLGTMISLSNAAINMYLYACTQSKFRQEVITCVKYILWRFRLITNDPSGNI
ncbi:putative G-protein coupled receptor 142 [Silurus asotus]|uniref:G-protein coupled receptor 142 n=1 Tax=Silurus asotus TaxID=30991 RepID=A0AAD5FLX3_SILAS|nr:putative G-protein coupled receptor 142 [Silurus asotus]